VPVREYLGRASGAGLTSPPPEGITEEVHEDRYGRTSTMLATQIPVSEWYDRLENATLSDAVMDRIIRNAYRLELKGESMRKSRSPLTHSGYEALL
jgi:DNA replication protein DnaC